MLSRDGLGVQYSASSAAHRPNGMENESLFGTSPSELAWYWQAWHEILIVPDKGKKLKACELGDKPESIYS